MYVIKSEIICAYKHTWSHVILLPEIKFKNICFSLAQSHHNYKAGILKVGTMNSSI